MASASNNTTSCPPKRGQIKAQIFGSLAKTAVCGFKGRKSSRKDHRRRWKWGNCLFNTTSKPQQL
uniref:Uncharacterized protein n=1 Tax=Fagus sylvatica TaxID=28930 RepID=A0A2N9I5H8_FAGSY